MARHPNLIFITAHDIGRRLGCYGFPEIASPRLDRLAGQGLQLKRACCSHPQCSPARASLFTGRYPHSNGVMGLVHGHFGWDLYPDEEHLAPLLKQHGYRTGLVGIQHATSREADLGFEAIRRDPEDKSAARVADHSVELLAAFAATAEDAPFYLQIGFFEGHRWGGSPAAVWGPTDPGNPSAVTVPAYLEDTEDARRELGQLHTVIAEMDTALGRILDALEAQGLADDTLIVFAADHGIPFPRAKTSCYEAGLEIACLMHGPGVRPGTRSDALVSGVDVMPTVLDLLNLPPGNRVQGTSFAGIARGQTDHHRTYLFGEQTYHNYPDPIRSVRDDRYKLILKMLPTAAVYNSTQQWAPRTTTTVPGNPKNFVPPMVEGYDLQTDPDELTNLADTPDFRDHQDRLLAALRQHLQDTNDPILHGLPLPPRFAEAQRLLGR